MDWAKKRKIIYAIIFAGIVILLAAYPVYKLTTKPPTCFDKKQNGTERGIDCGGSCALMCAVDVKPPRAVWAKTFPTNGGTYDIGAYLENVNVDAGIKNARYTIRVFDANGSVLGEKKGVTDFPPASRVLIFETGAVFVGTPERVEIAIDSDDLKRWTKAKTALSSVVTKNQNLKNVDTTPRFDAVMVNTDPVNEAAGLTLGIVVYDRNHYPVAVSKTYIDSIPKAGEQSFFFTWPSRFTKHARGELCPVPVDTVVVLDRSGSMDVGRKDPVEPFSSAKKAIKDYIDVLNPGDKVGIVSFVDNASSTRNLELSADLTIASTTLAALVATKPTRVPSVDLGDALALAASELKGSLHVADAKQVMIVLTDGNTAKPSDSASPKNKQYAFDYAAQVALDARKNNIATFALGFGKNINEAFLRDSIAGSFAHYFSTSTSDIMKTIYGEVSQKPCPTENFITEIVVTPRAIFSE